MRAKRNERPEPEFWVRFERELKTKQKLLIQKQLVSESRLKSPLSARLFKVGTFTATCGIAAVAVYLGIQTPIGDAELAQTEVSAPLGAAEEPTFTVAVAEQPQIQEVGLKEFSTLARPNAPRVVVHQSGLVAQTPTPTQLTAIETLASLEKTIRANRASGPTSTPAYQFLSSNGLFDTELVSLDEADQEVEGVWDFENAYMLGKYADPLTGTLPASHSNRSVYDIHHVSFSQIDEALTGQVRSSNRSLDALTVRF
ncbi:hypothetical protein [Pelagicoccus mobilis]